MRAGLLSSETVFVLGGRGSGLEMRSAVGGGVPVNTVLPSLDNTSPRDGDTLTVSPGTWTNSPTSYTYQWYTPVLVPGSTDTTYTVGDADVTNQIFCQVFAHNAAGDSIGIYTEPSNGVRPYAPVNTLAPTVTSSGDLASPFTGEVLNVDNGTWNYSPTGYAYYWKWEDGTIIDNPLNSQHLIAEADAGHQIHCTVEATNAGGSTDADSGNTSGIIHVSAPINTGQPNITSSGDVNNPVPGDTLNCDTGQWLNSPDTFNYLWSNGANGNIYEVQISDVGAVLQCQVSASNAGGSASAASHSTGTVQGA